MSLRHWAHRRNKIKERSGLGRKLCMTVAGLCLVNVPLASPNFSDLITIHFFKHFSHMSFFSLCTYTILNSTSIILHAAGPVLSRGAVGFQDKILEQRKSDPGCFFLWVPSLKQVFPRYFPPPEVSMEAWILCCPLENKTPLRRRLGCPHRTGWNEVRTQFWAPGLAGQGLRGADSRGNKKGSG